MPSIHIARSLAGLWPLVEKTSILRFRQCILPLLVLLTSTGVSPESSATEITLLSSPAVTQSHLSRLTSDTKGQLWLSWVSSTESNSSLHYAHYDDKQPEGEKWSAPRQIAAGNDWFVNWADFPFLSVHDQGMVAHWLRKRDAGTYDYDIVASFYDASVDQWGPPITIHKDGVSAEHGFVSMQPLPEGRTFITWLDGRNTAATSEHQPADGHIMTTGMTLRGGIFDRKGQTQQEWELDDLTCDCCQTSVAMAASGPVVVYRDRTDKEIRDIYITRLIGEQWTPPVAVYADNWKVAGCPVNGPAVVARDQTVAVAWFTAKNEQPRVKLALSVDGGASFALPILVDEGKTNGRVSLALLPDGDMAVSWLVTEGSAANIKVARYSKQGKLRDSTIVAKTRSSRRSGFPVLASVGDDLYVTWTDITDGMQVKIARIEF
jgi:hypothetical protein